MQLATKSDIDRATDMSGPHPRVFINSSEWGTDYQWRRPFRRKGAWCVRRYGTAALCKPRETRQGLLIFPITYCWPQPGAKQ